MGAVKMVLGLSVTVYRLLGRCRYRAAYDPTYEGSLKVSDFFVWTVEAPAALGLEGTSPGPLTCVVFSIVTAPRFRRRPRRLLVELWRTCHPRID